MAKRLTALFTSFSLPHGDSRTSNSMSPDSATSSPRRQSPTEPGRSKSPAARFLRKPAPQQVSHSRTSSGQYLTPGDATLPSSQTLQDDTTSLPPPPTLTGGDPSSRPSSRGDFSAASSRPGTPNFSRPATPSLQIPGQTPITPTSPGSSTAGADGKKKSHFGMGKLHKKEDVPQGPAAWIAGNPQKLPYDTENLLTARPMPELWDDSDGNCFVYLFPRISGKGASFKVDSAIFASSPVLTKLAFGDLYSSNPDADRRSVPLDARTQQLSINDFSTPPDTPQKSDTVSSSNSRDSRGRLSNLSDGSAETNLYLPIKLNSDNPHLPTTSGKSSKHADSDPATDDFQTLIDIRNLFAFLCGQALVATERKPSFFQIFLSIAGILKTYEFSNLDGSTYGEIASGSFDSYVEELGLADVRHSREKTIEGVVLGERMKSVLLYNEAFTHAAGKYDDLIKMKNPKYNLISPITQNRLARAAMDLEKRLQSVRLILEDFDFPSLFTGIMNSKQSEERKEGVRFDEWKDAWYGTRKWTMATLAQRYGHWPPKASSKKNNLETSGLNRQVLLDLYQDFSSLYDLLVDRTNLTTRTVDGAMGGAKEEPTIRALRAVLSEYDRSTPPVKPPVPFDLPRLPDLRTTRPDFGTSDKKKEAKALVKKLKDDEIGQILRASWNEDTVVTPFLDAFRDKERRAAHGCNIQQIVDLRIGQWIFMYVVLQALPMLACDAPGIKHTKGVEYFLCEPPRSGVPWANPNVAGAGGGARTWFSVGEGGGVVSLPSDVVEHGVEGIYRRSHCWVMAEQWSAHNPILNSALHEQEAMNAAQSSALGDGLTPPPIPGGDPGRRSSSPGSHRLSTFGLGLEALPLPVGVSPDGRSQSPRPASVHSQHTVDANKTFDAILGEVGQKDSKKKGKKR
jgi:hypothetical protein